MAKTVSVIAVINKGGVRIGFHTDELDPGEGHCHLVKSARNAKHYTDTRDAEDEAGRMTKEEPNLEFRVVRVVVS